VSEAPSATAAQLAVVWSETRLELADQGSDLWALPEVMDSSTAPPVAEDAAALITPDWMFSAVAALEADSESTEKEDG
jgi:hypothetical protein